MNSHVFSEIRAEYFAKYVCATVKFKGRILSVIKKIRYSVLINKCFLPNGSSRERRVLPNMQMT